MALHVHNEIDVTVDVDRFFSAFLQSASDESCVDLVTSLVPCVELAMEAFKKVGRYQEIREVNQKGEQHSAYALAERYPSPGMDEVRTAIGYKCFGLLTSLYDPENVSFSKDDYNNVLKSHFTMPETNQESIEQNGLAAVQVLMPLWTANSHHPLLTNFRSTIHSFMRQVDQFENGVADLPLDSPGRSICIKLIWKLRDEIMFSVDRVGKKYSRDCFRQHCHRDVLQYELDLLAEKMKVRIEAGTIKVKDMGNLETVASLVDDLTALSSELGANQMDVLVDPLQVDDMLDEAQSSLISHFTTAPGGYETSRHKSLLDSKILGLKTVKQDPLMSFVTMSLQHLTTGIDALEDHTLSLLSEGEGPDCMLEKARKMDLVRVLREDIICIIDSCSQTEPNNNNIQSAMDLMARKMRSHIAAAQKKLQLIAAAEVFAILDRLVIRLDYILLEQPTFLRSYAELMASIEDFGIIVGEMSAKKCVAVAPYAQQLQTYASNFCRDVVDHIDSPRGHVAVVERGQAFQEKAGEIISKADEALQIHRHPKWLRVGVQLMMSIGHFIAACFSRGAARNQHHNLAVQLFHTEHLPPPASQENVVAVGKINNNLIAIGNQMKD